MTLFETLVTLVLAVLLSALAFPSMERSARSLAVAEARVQLVADLRVARGRATAQDRIVTVRPASGGAGYAFDGVPRTLPQGTTLGGGGDGGIAFHPDGSAAGGALRLFHGGDTALITVDPTTGSIALREGRAR